MDVKGLPCWLRRSPHLLQSLPQGREIKICDLGATHSRLPDEKLADRSCWTIAAQEPQRQREVQKFCTFSRLFGRSKRKVAQADDLFNRVDKKKMRLSSKL